MADSYQLFPETGSAHISIFSEVLDINVSNKFYVDLILFYSSVLLHSIDLVQGWGLLLYFDLLA